MTERASNMNLFEQGFRLIRLEFVNWGTFANGKVFSIETEGKTSLITGANGSGKSTIVDALLTLLVPSQKRNYNLASGTERKRDRDEKTYVQGNFGKLTDESTGSRILRMRDPDGGHVSVLLAIYYNAESSRYICIAQVLWFDNGTLQKFYVVAERKLSIKENFQHSGDMRNFKKSLKNTDSVKVFDSFKEYIHEFIKGVGLRSEKALDLFNQIVAIKSIGNLKEFIREHMLEKHDMNERIEELDKNYKNLSDSYNAILQASKQLQELTPIEEDSKRYEMINGELINIEGAIHTIPAFFSEEKISLLKESLQTTKFNLQKLEDFIKDVQSELDRKREEEKTLYAAREGDTLGRRLNEMQKQLNDEKRILAARQITYNKYRNICINLFLETNPDTDSFHENRKKANEKLKQNAGHLLEIEKKRDEWIIKRNNLHNYRTELQTELNSLKTRKTLLPGQLLETRRNISNALGLKEEDLPYACELMQVKSKESAWAGAIEKLMGGFGKSILVADKHYSAFNEYINSVKLNGKLVYYRIVETSDKIRRPDSTDTLFYKLEFKPNSPFTPWLESRILNDFNYHCAENINEFNSTDRAITREGLIKHNKTRHEKDDRFSVSDKSRYILGWSNTEKVKALEAELLDFDKKYDEAYESISSFEKEKESLRKTDSQLNELIRYESYTDIDIHGTEKMIAEIEKHLKELESNSGSLHKLHEQLAELKSEIEKLEKSRDDYQKKKNNLERDISDSESEIADCESVLELIRPEELARFKPEIEKYTSSLSKLTIHNIRHKQNEVFSILERQKKDREDVKQRVVTNLVGRMKSYIKDFETDSTELTAEVESIEDFRRELKRIQEERLPQFQERFRQMMDEKVTHQIVEFREDLQEQEDEIRDKIKELNQALETIDYVPGYTFIQLDCTPTINLEIQDFKDMLKDCIPDINIPESNERKFQKIKELLDKLKNRSSDNTDRWVKLVTDVRNWLDFRAIEFSREDRKQKEVYDSSAGKSGGQTVKLAYTILASAISYQFGIKEQKSFRLVVIDEMFNNLDNQNSRFAMNLFKQLGLQLLVVTPLDKISIVEPYISSIHLVANTQEGKDSRVYPITIDALNKKKAVN